jgi:hypothetical protein
VRTWPSVRERASERRKGMTGGTELSVRERGSVGAGATGLGYWATRHGRARERECGRERASRLFGWAEQEQGRRSRPELSFCFSFSKI